MAWEAAQILHQQKKIKYMMNNFWFQPLSSSGEPITAYTAFRDDYSYRITSMAKDREIVHAEGRIVYENNAVDFNENVIINEIKARCYINRAPDEIYRQIWTEGQQVGPSM